MDMAPLKDDASTLVCPHGHRYPVVKDIPRFVSQSTYVDAFGLQWIRYRKTQLDSFTGCPISRDRLIRCLGGTLWNGLQGKLVLECGCGAGRFTELLLNQGAVVTSIDLSVAVDANIENCPVTVRHRIAQADILQLPVAPRQFDLVICLGVVQHTPDPERTIKSLYSAVKPGGYLVVDHYTYNLSWYMKTAPLFRQVLKRLPPEAGMRATELLVRSLLPFHRALAPYRLPSMLLTRLSPVLCYYRTYPELNAALQREWALLDTHDSLTDWFKHFRTRRQIAGYLRALGATQVEVSRGGNGLEARGRRSEPIPHDAH